MTRPRDSVTSLSLARAGGRRGRGTRRRGRAGFTLIELSVALLAGLLVSMALVQVSKEANNTFHEEVRASAAEMSLRIALERLRLDLQRASYMSTGNIAGDTGIARVFGSTTNLSNVAGVVPGISRLAGVFLQYGGSVTNAPSPGLGLDTNATNNLNPDTLQLSGNFSSTDEYVGYMCPSPPGGGGCAGQTICLEWNTPAMWRIRNTGAANAPATLQSYFNPSYYSNPTVGLGTTRFMARVTDDSGRYMYVMTCQGANATSMTATAASVNLDPSTTILTTAQTGGRGGTGGLAAGRVIISPLQTVSWQIQPAGSIPAAGTNAYGATATADPNEYVLTRAFVDAKAGAPYLPDPNTLEVVSEYAVDLKFAFTVDSSNPLTTKPPGAYPLGSSPFQFLLLDSNTNATWAPDVSLSPYLAPIGPQRIRSVRVRTAIRTATADRIADVVPSASTPGQPYLYRYFIPGTLNGLQWARVRTGVTEVSLPNQARYYW